MVYAGLIVLALGCVGANAGWEWMDGRFGWAMSTCGMLALTAVLSALALRCAGKTHRGLLWSLMAVLALAASFVYWAFLSPHEQNLLPIPVAFGWILSLVGFAAGAGLSLGLRRLRSHALSPLPPSQHPYR